MQCVLQAFCGQVNIYIGLKELTAEAPLILGIVCIL